CSVSFVVRLFFIRALTGLRISRYARNVIVPCLVSGALSLLLSLLWARLLDGTGHWAWVVSCLLIGLSTAAILFAIGLTAAERQFVWDSVKRFLTKKKQG
ncbi:MAG: hypothetical protein J5871_05040, partial [Bacteroidales bacterium]|nr:hypothetical protein [Bacteroidales bacterium]